LSRRPVYSDHLVETTPTSTVKATIAAISVFMRRTAGATKIVVRHRGIPRPIRWLAGIGLLPVPGPFDEAVLLLVALVLFVFYRPLLREAWDQALWDR
jgi:hypothetical protein